ncbi:MAG TPA: GNAT family N-acetyltransferase [Candidatus Saccharimonadaceae bacterium]|nr:GNAT family N-acetyltransferase [Candidatus Saccharimonadaceae bacterium]
MQFTVRSARSEDLSEMYAISVAAHQAGYGSFIPLEEKERFNQRYTLSKEGELRYVTSMQAKLDDPEWLFWVAEGEGKVLGYTLAQRESDTALHKKGMFVHPRHQGEGVGSALFKASLGGIDHGEIDLIVISDNLRAKHIYQKSGFVVRGPALKSFYGAPQEVMALVKH